MGQVEQIGVFALAEILGLEEFGQTDDLRAARRGLVDFIDGALQILVGVGRGGHLHQSDIEFLRRQSGCLLKEKKQNTSFPVFSSRFSVSWLVSGNRLQGSSRVVQHNWGCNLKHDNHDGAGMERHLHDPIEDRLVPLEPLDLSQVHSIDDLVRAMSKTAFTGRQLGEAADVLEAMARDKDCFVVMTLAGAMTVAKQGLVVAELIDRGIVNAIVSTGALMAHGLVEATGRAHFRYNPEVSDEELYEQGYNRVYDTLEPETESGRCGEGDV